MILKSKMVGAIVLVVVFGGILLTSLLGGWQTGVSREPSLILSGEAAGKPNPADVRGSYSFGDISTGYGIPVADLKTAFRVPESVDGETFQVKGLEVQFAEQLEAGKEIGADSMRLFVAYYTGLPFTIASDIYLPVEAANLLKQRGNLTPDQVTYLDGHALIVKGGAAPAPAAATQPAANAEPAADARIVSGSTTFQQLLDWGVPQAAIESVLGGPMPAASSIAKDYFVAKGLEFSAYKLALQKEVDKIK